MGSISQFLDFNQENASRKLWANKRHNDGIEAPRNSAELPTEPSLSSRVIHDDDIPYSCQVKHPTSKMLSYPNGPTDSFKQSEQQPRPYGFVQNAVQTTKNPLTTRLQTREHPQEDELQKFKQEFLAWQRSKSLELEKNLRQSNIRQVLEEENLHSDKRTMYRGKSRSFAEGNSMEAAKSSPPSLKAITPQGAYSRKEDFNFKQWQSKSKSVREIRSTEAKNYGFRGAPVVDDVKLERFSPPSRIVILKPSSDDNSDIERNWYGSTDIVEMESGITDFLEEVKEKLILEIEGRAQKSSMGKQQHIRESCFRKSSSESKHISNQIREKENKEIGTSLTRSESTKSSKSEVEANDLDSPDFINKNTRNFLSERFKNVLKNDVDTQLSHNHNGGSRPSSSLKASISRVVTRVCHRDDKRNVSQPKTRSLGRDRDNDTGFDGAELSPSYLVRSYSAPVTRSAFGKLLSEDNDVQHTRDHIRRKHESSDHSSPKSRKTNDGFNLKGTVSSLKQNLSFKGKFFGKKSESKEKSFATKLDPMMAFVNAPSVVTNYGVIQDNFTEVPPSPASVFSSSPDDYFGPSNPSPVSPLEAPFIEGNSSTKVSVELCLDPSELRDTSMQTNSGCFEEVAATEQYTASRDEKVENESPTKAYVRDILVSAGIYDDSMSLDQTFMRWEELPKPIPKWIFEEVEESFNRNGSLVTDQRMLFDLVNEMLPSVLAAPYSSRYAFGRWLRRPTSPPWGKVLLDGLWRQIHSCFESPDKPDSVDDMVERDMKMISPLSSGPRTDIDDMGSEMELVILGELIGELACELLI